MKADAGSQKSNRRTIFWSALALVVIALVTVGTLYLIHSTEPTAERSGATRRTAALVETVIVQSGDYRPELITLGEVTPAQEIDLRARVSGQIVELSPIFEPGAMVGAGETLVRIDPADYANEVAILESALREAQANLEIERGRRAVAEAEFALLGESIDETNRALVLREPQIASAEARVAAARANLDRARLDFERTHLKAPFDAQVLEREISLGSETSAGQTLGHLVGTDTYWVIATLPLRRLQWVEFADAGKEGAPVTVIHRGAWDKNQSRTGRVSRLIGAVDDQTRLARILVVVEDPLARHTDGPPLLVGTVVEARIRGRPLESVFRLDRGQLRKDDTVWVFEDGKLAIREVDVVLEDETHAYIRGGLNDGDEVVTTNLAAISPGLLLRRVEESAAGKEELNRE